MTTNHNASHRFISQVQNGTDGDTNPLAGLAQQELDPDAAKSFAARAQLRKRTAAIAADPDLTEAAKARKIKAMHDEHNSRMFALDAQKAEQRAKELAQVKRSLFEPAGIDGADYRSEVRRLSTLDSEGLVRAIRLAEAANDKATLRAILTVADQTDDSVVMQQLLQGPLAEVADEYVRYSDLVNGGPGSVFDAAITA